MGEVPLESIEFAYRTELHGQEDTSAWIHKTLSKDTTSHTLKIPAAVPSSFKVRAHCNNGDVTDYSEALTVYVGLDGHPATNNLPPPPPRVVSARVQSEATIECISFEFEDGTSKVLRSLEATMQTLTARMHGHILILERTSASMFNLPARNY